MSDELIELEDDSDIELVKLREDLALAQSQLATAQHERELAVQLTRAGVVDLDAALKLAGQGDNALAIVEQLKTDKPYLFAGQSKAGPGITAGVRPLRGEPSLAKLRQASQQASASGNRRDLYEYLKLRRVLKK